MNGYIFFILYILLFASTFIDFGAMNNRYHIERRGKKKVDLRENGVDATSSKWRGEAVKS